MLVSYMQLLGLLRLVRLNWSHWLQQVLKTMIYIDFTSGAAIWVSLECSFAEGGPLPKSLRRSLVLMLWPCESSSLAGPTSMSMLLPSTTGKGIVLQILRPESSF